MSNVQRFAKLWSAMSHSNIVMQLLLCYWYHKCTLGKAFFQQINPRCALLYAIFFIQRVYVQRIKVNHVKNRRMMYSYSRNSSNFCDVTTSVHRRVSRAASRRLLTKKKKKCYGRYGPHLSVEEGKPFLDFIIKAVKQTHKWINTAQKNQNMSQSCWILVKNTPCEDADTLYKL